MNLDSLKTGFLSYITEKLKQDGKEDQAQKIQRDSDISIFKYANEFKEYLSEEVRSDVNLKSKSISEILDMEIVNGELVSADDYDFGDEESDLYTDDENVDTSEKAPAKEETENETDISQEAAANGTPETDATAKEGEIPEENSPEASEPEEEEISLEDILNDFLKDDDFIKALDSDEDGELSKNEIKEFLSDISALDGDKDNISLEDILLAAEQMQKTEENTPSQEEETNESTNASDKTENKKSASPNKNSVDKYKKGLNEGKEASTRNTENKRDSNRDTNGTSRMPSSSESSPTTSRGSSGNSQGVSNGGGSQGVSNGGGNSYGGSYGGGNSYGGGTSSYPSSSASSGTKSAAKSVDNMNVDELKQELSKAEKDLDTKNNTLSSILDGSDSKVKSLEEAEEKAYEEYQDKLKEVDEEAAKELDDKKNEVSEKETQVSEDEQALSDAENSLSEAETSYDNAVSTTKSLEATLSTLNSTDTSNLSDSKKSELSTKKNEIQSQLNEAKAAETKAKEAVDKAKEDKEAAEEKLNTDKEELEKLQGELEEIEAKINEEHPEVEQLQQAYESAKQEKEDYKTEAAESAKEAVATAQDEVNKLQTKITEVQNKAVEASAKLSTLSGTYNYNGQDYDCVIDGNELAQMVRDAAAGGAGTKFGKEDKCLSIAETYGAWMTGDSNTSYDASGTYQDATKYSVYNTEDKDELLSVVKEELDSGNPCVLHVNGAGIGRHYVTVVGYKSSAGDKLQESDLLIWDSYDSTIGSCPDDRYMITGWSTGRTGSEGYGWQVYRRNGS